MKVIKRIKSRGKMFLNPGIRSVKALIKSKCKIRPVKQRSIIKSRKLNSLIEPCTGGKKLDFNNPNGSSIKMVIATYPFIPVKPHLLFKKGREWIKFASQKKESCSIPAKLNILINKNVLTNQVTCLTRPVSHDAKVKSFIPDKPSVLINNSNLGDQVIYLEVNHPLIPVEYLAINKKSNTMKEKSILRIDRSTLVGAYSFQKKDPRNSASCISHPGKNRLMVKYREVSEKSEMKELIKNSNRLPYCFTIRSRHREKSLHELFKRRPLMTTLKHSCNSLPGIYEQECIGRIIPLKHFLCLKLQKMTFQSPKRYKDKINFFRCPFFAIKKNEPHKGTFFREI